jgi:hypothetical protein
MFVLVPLSSRANSGQVGLALFIPLAATVQSKRLRLSKAAPSHLRKLLYMPAVVARNWNPHIKSFSDRRPYDPNYAM